MKDPGLVLLDAVWESMLNAPIPDDVWAIVYRTLGTNDPHGSVKRQVIIAAGQWHQSQARLDRGYDPNWKKQLKRWAAIERHLSAVMKLLQDDDAPLFCAWGEREDRTSLVESRALLSKLIEGARSVQDAIGGVGGLHVRNEKAPSRHNIALYDALIEIWKTHSRRRPSVTRDPVTDIFSGDCFEYMRTCLKAIMGSPPGDHWLAELLERA